MALSCLLRGSINICRASPSFSIASRLSPLSTCALTKLSVTPTKKIDLQNKLTVPVQGLGLQNAIRSFSVTPAKLSVGGIDHGKLWSIEKMLSTSLIAIFPLGLMFPNILFDLLMAVATTIHVHWGIEAVVIDYLRPIIFGRIIPKIGLLLVYVYSILLLVGLLNLTFRGAGIGNSVKALWRVNKNDD